MVQRVHKYRLCYCACIVLMMSACVSRVEKPENSIRLYSREYKTLQNAKHAMKEHKWRTALELFGTLHSSKNMRFSLESKWNSARIYHEIDVDYKSKLLLEEIISSEYRGNVYFDALILLADISYKDYLYEDAYAYYLRYYKNVSKTPVKVLIRLVEISWFALHDRPAALHYLEILENAGRLSSQNKTRVDKIRESLIIEQIPIKNAGIEDFNISSLYVDNDDIWIGTWNGAIIRYSVYTDSFSVLQHASLSINPQTVKGFAVIDNTIFISTYGGFHTYNKNNGVLEPLQLPPQVDPLRLQDIACHDGVLYAATLGNGLWMYTEDAKWSQLQTGALGLMIGCLKTDGEDLLVGTFGKGLFVVTSKKIQKYNSSKVLTGKKITAIEKYGEVLYIGTFGDGLFVSNPDRTIRLDTGAGSLSQNNWILCSITYNDMVLFGTFGNGIGIYDHSTDIYREFSMRDGLGSNDVAALAVFKKLILAGTLYQGVQKIHAQNF